MKILLNFIKSVFILGNTLVYAQSSGSLDATFNSSGTGPSAAVWSMALQTDGKIIIAGGFTNYNGANCNRITRLNSNGTLDATFTPGTGANNYINVVALQLDGKILIGGAFTSYNGTTSNYIARLNSNGTLDASFNIGTGTSFNVNAIEVQTDGKILIGGEFISYNGTNCNRIVRLNSNGTIDGTFNSGSGANSYVEGIALQPDGKILIAGSFTSYNGVARNHFTRLNSNGSLDTSFANVGGASIYVICVQPDGKILTNGGTKNINRFNSNGTIDISFNSGNGTGGSVSAVSAIALQTDGRILISGYFTSYNGTTRKRIARLNANGSLDASFDPSIVYMSQVTSINSILIESNAKIIIGGLFTQYNGTSLNNLVRLHNCIGSQSSDLVSVCGSTYTWINGNTYTANNNSAFHTISGGSSNGCDSIVYLNLTLNPIATSTDIQTFCSGGSLTWIDGNTYLTSNNTATHTIINGAANGCDSIITLSLTVNQPTNNSYIQSACNNYVWHAATYSISNTYTYNYTNSFACASTDTLHLTINSNPLPNITVTNDIQLSTQSYSNYQWLFNNNIITGATLQNYTVTQNGDYSVFVTDGNGCTSTSPSISVTSVGIEEENITSRGLKVYPNPVYEILIIESNIQNFELKILNVLGEIVLDQKINSTNTVIDVRNFENGVYFVKAGNGLQKFIKN